MMTGGRDGRGAFSCMILLLLMIPFWVFILWKIFG
jgi:hypothetical protein